MNDFLSVSCPSEIKVKVKIECRRWVISRYSVIASTHTSFPFLLLNSSLDAHLHSLHPSIPWQHELSLSVTVTWASNNPHITAGFDWPGLSRSASRCLIITLFDCWSRDVIDWSASPVWGQASEVAFTCVCGCVHVSFCGGGKFWRRSSDNCVYTHL